MRTLLYSLSSWIQVLTQYNRMGLIFLPDWAMIRHKCPFLTTGHQPFQHLQILNHHDHGGDYDDVLSDNNDGHIYELQMRRHFILNYYVPVFSVMQN